MQRTVGFHVRRSDANCWPASGHGQDADAELQWVLRAAGQIALLSNAHEGESARRHRIAAAAKLNVGDTAVHNTPTAALETNFALPLTVPSAP